MHSVHSVFVAGHLSAQHNSGPSIAIAKQALSDLFNALIQHCSKRDKQLRLLTGADSPIEQEVANLTAELNVSLHLISAGMPHPLSHSQMQAERQVWLGADNENASSEEGKSVLTESKNVRNQIALGFSNSLLIVWNGSSQEEGIIDLLLNAALAMKFVLWIDHKGDVRALERNQLTPAVMHLLDCPKPSLERLKECFTSSLSDYQILEKLNQSEELTANDLIQQVPAYKASDLKAGQVHKVMMALVQANFRKLFAAIKARPLSAYRGPAWEGSKELVQPTPNLDQPFDNADVAASIAAGKHRSSAWISSMASTGAVFAAVAGAIHLWVQPHAAFWSVLELVLVALIVSLLWRSQKKQWHTAWISSRFLAEQLRYARMGLPLMVVGKTLTEPAFAVFPNSNREHELCLVSEDLYKIQDALSNSGLPVTPNGQPYVAASSQNLVKIQEYVLSVIKDQTTYHQRVHHEHHSVEHVLHRLSMVLFTLTAIAIGAHFWLHAEWLLIFTAFFPALAAGIHGLSTSLEIARLSEQSEATADQLEDLHVAIESVLEGGATRWQKWIHLRHLTLLASEVMSDENSQWQKLVTHQKPKLPA
jgi:hypothetical protein